jgi:uncharacterized DUF497 family protein
VDEPWDQDKARANLRKHGVSFDEAETVENDEHVWREEDWRFTREERVRLIGYSSLHRLLFVAGVDRNGKIRPISAWRATKREIDGYFARLSPGSTLAAGLDSNPAPELAADAARPPRRPPRRRRRIDC